MTGQSTGQRQPATTRPAAVSPMGSSYTGITLGLLKDAQANAALDLINVMSYDAGPTYSPLDALTASILETVGEA